MLHFLSLCPEQFGLELGGDSHIGQIGEEMQMGAAFTQDPHLTPVDLVLQREEPVGCSPTLPDTH